MGMGGRGKHSIAVTVEFVTCIIVMPLRKCIVRASGLLLVVNGSMHASYGRASCKHLVMITLLPPVTRCREERCRHRTSAGKKQ